MHIEGLQTPPPPQDPSLGVLLAGKDAIICTPHNIDKCSVYKPDHVFLGLFPQREKGGKSPKLQIPKLQKHMDLRPYAPAAETHENFSYAFVKTMVLGKWNTS